MSIPAWSERSTAACLAAALLLAAVGARAAEAAEDWRAALRARQQQADRELAERKNACAQRFAVSDCERKALEDWRANKRAIDQEHASASRGERQQAAEARRKSSAQRQQANELDQRERARSGLQAAPGQARPASADARKPKPVRGEPRSPSRKPRPDDAQRAARAAADREARIAQQRRIQSEIDRRRSEAASKGQRAKPLSTPETKAP